MNIILRTFENDLRKLESNLFLYYIKNLLVVCIDYPYSAQCKSKSRHLGGWEGTSILHSPCILTWEYLSP